MQVPEGHFATVRWSHKRRNCPGNHIIKPLNFMQRVMNSEISTLKVNLVILKAPKNPRIHTYESKYFKYF